MNSCSGIEMEVRQTQPQESPMKTSQARISQRKHKELLLELLPNQGQWSEEEYLWLTDHTSRLVEFTDGFLEPMPMPTGKHQTILQFLFLAFRAFIYPRRGKVHFAALR